MLSFLKVLQDTAVAQSSTLFFSLLPSELINQLFGIAILGTPPEELKAILASPDPALSDLKSTLRYSNLWYNLFLYHFPNATNPLKRTDCSDWCVKFWSKYEHTYGLLNNRQKRLFSLFKLGEIELVKEMKPTLRELNIQVAGDDIFSWVERSQHQEILDYIYLLVLEEWAREDDWLQSWSRYPGSQLHLAAWLNQPLECSRFIAEGAEVNMVNDDNKTPLSIAVMRGHAGVVKILLTAGADKDFPLLLNRAVRNGHTQVLELMLNSGVKIGQKVINTLLTVAVEEGHAEDVKLLLTAGAQIDEADPNSTPLLYTAAENGHADMIELLQSKGADIDKTKSSDGQTPLYVAAKRGHAHVVELLLKAGADIYKASLNGEIPLDAAVQSNYADVVILLLTARTYKGPLLNNCSLLLHVAAKHGSENVIELLLRKDANIDQRTKDGSTPLHIASREGKEAIVKLLLSRGANPLLVNSQHKRPYNLATTPAISNLLLEAEKKQLQKEKDVEKLELMLRTKSFRGGQDDLLKALVCLKQAIETGKASLMLDDSRDVLNTDPSLQVILNHWFPKISLPNLGKVQPAFIASSPANPIVNMVKVPAKDTDEDKRIAADNYADNKKKAQLFALPRDVLGLVFRKLRLLDGHKLSQSCKVARELLDSPAIIGGNLSFWQSYSCPDKKTAVGKTKGAVKFFIDNKCSEKVLKVNSYGDTNLRQSILPGYCSNSGIGVDFCKVTIYGYQLTIMGAHLDNRFDKIPASLIRVSRVIALFPTNQDNLVHLYNRFPIAEIPTLHIVVVKPHGVLLDTSTFAIKGVFELSSANSNPNAFGTFVMDTIFAVSEPVQKVTNVVKQPGK